MSTHTPGPWRWMNNEALVADHGRRRAILTADGFETCGDDGRLRPLDIDEPNARLIAAAPDLLTFVRAFANTGTSDEVPGYWPPEEMDKVIRHARTLIAKAEGRS